MPYRKENIKANNYYHLYNRGVNKKQIFFEERNYSFLLKRLKSKFEKNAKIICYCFMPNHFHLIIKVVNVEEFCEAVKNVFISYVKAINKSRNRRGPLFESRDKIKIIPENNYLLHLSRYIHLNPIRAGLVFKPADWKFSSYPIYIGLGNDDSIHHQIITGEVQDYKGFVEEYQNSQYYNIKEVLF